MGKIARGLVWRFSKSPERKWGWFEKRQNGSQGLFSQNCPIKLCYSWLIACKHLIKVFFWSRADFKLVGNLGLIGPAVTGILHCNVINHAIMCIITYLSFYNNIFSIKMSLFNKIKKKRWITCKIFFLYFLPFKTIGSLVTHKKQKVIDFDRRNEKASSLI